MTDHTPEQISAMVYRLKTLAVAARAYATPSQGLIFSAAFDAAASMLAAWNARSDIIPNAAYVAVLESAAIKTLAAAELREAYHRLPNEKTRIGESKSPKSKARDAWLKAFRRAVSATSSALSARPATPDVRVVTVAQLEEWAALVAELGDVVATCKIRAIIGETK